MAQASRDGNLVPTLLGVSSVDGVTPVPLYADPTTHRLLTSSSGGAAPSDATYVTLSTNVTLSNERVLTGTANQITITDNGAGSTVVLSLPQSIATASTPTFASMTLTAASSLTLGTASTNTGSIILKNATNANNLTLIAGVTAGSYSLTLPTSGGTNGYFLQTNGSGTTTWAAATATPGGADTQVQFNDGGSLGGDADFVWDKTNNKLSIGGSDTMTVNGSATSTRQAIHMADSATASALELEQNSDTAGRGAVTYLARSRGTFGAKTAVQSGDSLAEIYGIGHDGTDFATAAKIAFEVDGTPGSNDMPGRIVFSVAPDGSQTVATALTISNTKAATFVGTVTMPTPFTLGATSVTTTGTQLNYLNAATGTTGTTSTNLVFSTSPTLVTPVLGAATATSINGLTITSSTGTLTITNGKTVSFSNSITFAGTDSTTMTFPGATDTVMGLGAVQTVTAAKTFNSATLVATRPKFVTSIDDTNGNEVFVVTATASAVNELTIANAATGNNPAITASGGDSNVGIDVTLKGTGTFNLKGNSTQAAELRLYEDTDNGTNYTAFKVGSQAGNVTYTLPTADGSSGQSLQTNGSGTLSWASAAAAAPGVIPLFSPFTGRDFAFNDVRMMLANGGITNVRVAYNTGTQANGYDGFWAGEDNAVTGLTPSVDFCAYDPTNAKFYAAADAATSWYRYNNDDTFTGETVITVSGTGVTSLAGIAVTANYGWILDGTTTIRRYTISGTTWTHSANISLGTTTGATTRGFAVNAAETIAYIDDATNLLYRKVTLADGTQSATRNKPEVASNQCSGLSYDTSGNLWTIGIVGSSNQIKMLARVNF